MEQTNKSSANTVKNTLSIQVSLNGLSFCTLDAKNQYTNPQRIEFGTTLSPEHVLDKVVHLFKVSPILNSAYHTLKVTYQNNLYTVVPFALFDEKMLSTYLQFNVKILANDYIAYDVLASHELVVVYIPYMNVNNFLFDTFGAFTYSHTITVLIDRLLSLEKNTRSTVVYAHKYEGAFDLIVITDGRLQMANTFTMLNKEDFLYHLLFATEQLSLNPEEFRLYCLGDFTITDDYYAIAHQYIRNISIMEVPMPIQSNYIDLSETEARKHYNLLSTF